jgi:hypothetical protein|nr:MAG TPA: hypothetical protein [Caudoviricetes sp.]
MPKSTTNLSLSTYDSTIDKDNLSKMWFDETFGYSNSNMTKIDDAYGELKESAPTKTGEGASGDWNINITGTAQTAIHDGVGNDINSTYVKDIEAKDGTLTVRKGNNVSSTVDISSPKGYVLSKEAYFNNSTDINEDVWLHIGNIKNTSDNDFLKVSVNMYIDGTLSIKNQETQSVMIEGFIGENICIHDKAQGTAELLNTAYTFFVDGYTNSWNSLQQDTALADDVESVSTVYLVPTSGGNGTSSAELWVYATSINLKVAVTVTTSDKNNWEFVLEESPNVTTSEFKISPLNETTIITSEDVAGTSNTGVVRIGSGIAVDEAGIISVSPAANAYVGGVKAGGDNIKIASDGTISVPDATSTTKGAVKIGQNLTVSDGSVSLTQDNVNSAIGFIPTKITAGTTDLTAGTSPLETGVVYLYYV